MNSGIEQRRTRMPDLSMTEALPGSVALTTAMAIQFAELTPVLKSKGKWKWAHLDSKPERGKSS
jgi:hypothetical protein